MTEYDPADRRPIASRDRRVFQHLAHQLARRGISANSISVAGMIAGVAAGATLYSTSFWPGTLLWLTAAALIQLRLLANMLDGMVAIETATASPVGELYNEVPDRIADVAILVGAGYAAGGDITLGWAAACVAVFVAYVRAMGVAAGGPNDFCGPMAKPHRMFLMTIAALIEGLLPDEWQPSLFDRGIPAMALAVIVVLGMLTALRRIARTAAALRDDEATG